MPTNPEALQQFLTRGPESHFLVRGKGEAWLRDVIHRTTGAEWIPKVDWRGDDRDIRQLEAIAFAIITKQALIYYAPRVGKTRVALDWLQHLVRIGWVRRALIIPHSPLGVDEWERQIPIFCDLQLSVVRSGPESSDQLTESLLADDHGLIITSSTLQSIFSVKKPNRKGVPKLYADRPALKLVAPSFDAIIIDEIHQINDPGSLRFDMLSELAPDTYSRLPGPQWRLGLTGTPFGRNPFGLWAQARLADGGKTLTRSYFFFEEAFGKRVYNHFSRARNEIIFDPKKMPALRAKLDHMVLTCKLEDIQDVNIISQIVELKMLREQNRAYQELIDELILDRSEEDTFSRTQNIFVRLRQVASGYRVFTDDEGQERVIDFPSAKLAWLEEFITDLDPDLKVILFHEFVRTGERVCSLLTKLKVKHTWLWGGTADKRSAKDQFQFGDVPVLVANHATGGVGIDLSAAHYLCVVESPVSSIGRQQMQMRPMARGGTPLVIDDLVCAPVERRILQFHSESRSLQELFSKPKKLADILR